MDPKHSVIKGLARYNNSTSDHFRAKHQKQWLERNCKLGRVKRIWCLSPMRAAKVQASLRICAVSPEPPLLAHTSSESRGTLRQKARSLAPLNGWACAVKICHDGKLEDTNSLDAAQFWNCVSIPNLSDSVSSSGWAMEYIVGKFSVPQVHFSSKYHSSITAWCVV